MNTSGRNIIVLSIIAIAFGAVCWVGLNAKSTESGSYAKEYPLASQDSDVDLTITYTGSGFEPDRSILAPNNQIRIHNRSQRLLEFVSDPIKTQSNNPELNVGQLKPGESKTFYVSQKGTWGYHNALDIGETGVLIVQ